MAIEIYKSGQGRYLRIGTIFGAAIVALVLGFYVWVVLDRHLPGMTPAEGQAVSWAGPYKVYLEYAIPSVLVAALMVVTLLYMNKAQVADFLIATESEMKKVSWSSRAELVGSTMVVIATVVLLAVVIWLVDTGIVVGLTRGLGLWR